MALFGKIASTVGSATDAALPTTSVHNEREIEPAARRARRPSRSRGDRREALIGYAYVLPFAVFLLCFGVAPSAYALLLSFHEQGGSVLSFTLAAYRFAFADPNFGSAVRHVIEF